MYVLYGRPGWGSALIEAQLAWYDLPYRFEPVGDLFADAAAREQLGRLNPIAQVPTLLLPDGAMMTESAAITLLLGDRPSVPGLVPPAGVPMRASFLRWLTFLVANVYPTFTYADDPSRFVAIEAARAPFCAAVEAYRQRMWQIVDQVAAQPWFLGDTFSALDIYVAVMTHWRPRRLWFAEHCPRLTAIARRADAEVALAEVWRRNFPPGRTDPD
ncbi:MAG: glutathione S-transferase family protein [Acetobacteraceae bacterium]